jgi:glycosyltransferase involved in cell wall biosynthesis
MKSVVLVPYCPLPADTGGKVEMLKHLHVLKELGACTILSAGGKPVGTGWTAAQRQKLELEGFQVVLREDDNRHLTGCQLGGIAYACLAKSLRLERAFGHSNPYHRYAFQPDWFEKHTADADLAVVNYSYWAGLPCDCSKAVVLLDLWSDYMWGGAARETRELASTDLVVAISTTEKQQLLRRGIEHTIWSPPFVDAVELPDSNKIGMVGSASRFNREGLRWLLSASRLPPDMQIYGGVGRYVNDRSIGVTESYAGHSDPYREAGIVLMTTCQGMGVQIKGIEALACGRAVIARQGAMRGLPPGNGAWIEVSSPQEMANEAMRLQKDTAARKALYSAAREYYREHLDSVRLKADLCRAYLKLAGVVADKP